MTVNDFEPYLDTFKDVEPFSGYVEKGFLIDFLGQRTSAEFRKIWGVDPETTGDGIIETNSPDLPTGEDWFEYFNAVAAAREARGSYVMMTLGACYGGQAVNAYLALQALNPMPAQLVAVDGMAENIEMTRKHFRYNGINPDDHWLIEAAMSGDNNPVLFPIGAPGSGAQNSVMTNSRANRMGILDLAQQSDSMERLAKNLLLRNSTDLSIDLAPGTDYDFNAEITFVSAVTLKDLLAPYARVDYVEADMQQSETVVFPPAMDALTQKVRRVHMGTHGEDVHNKMEKLFVDAGWDILFSYKPNQTVETPYCTMELNDGILTAVNPNLAYSD
ncbi:MAG: hypothetical protein HOK21_23255 [Rhodospirillaceae bacterium]|nr:hypothetical protein [Rhodospirillaceae bacterium]MBT4044702.1 hypothetical protein [Rhodospirillaceae bacterium]MBT4690845.1 hypothetical protein [Rhodospirillaceae bacterium]MBT5081574.1 hypothetical protein [Rhodospirillaceae bacterium]MBT5527016.1 hypothetical protein [Rhodospirillaceae bacterium]